MVRAILAAEDDAFFSHGGFDFGGIAILLPRDCGEFRRNMSPRGGSTITQQVVKNFFSLLNVH